MDTKAAYPTLSRKDEPSRLNEGEIKVWPELLLVAKNCKLHGAVRAWFAARHLDYPLGQGSVAKQKVVELLIKHGASSRTVRRWMREAQKLKLFTIVLQADGTEKLVLLSLEKTARILHCDRIGSFPVAIQIDKLFRDGWVNEVWGGVLAESKGRLISRATLEKKTGAKRQTQILREKGIKHVKTPHYAVSDSSPDHLTGIREHNHSHAFVFTWKGTWRSSGKRQTVAWQMPNSYSVDFSVARILKRGSTRKINRKLNPLASGSCNLGRALGHNGGFRLMTRVFSSEKEALKKTRNLDRSIEEVYCYRGLDEVIAKPESARCRFLKPILLGRIEK